MNVFPSSAPVASFTATLTTGNAPFIVYFTDTSSNNPTNWLWDFGDGTTSSLQNPQHKYSTPGTYTVRLNASNDVDYDIEEKSNYIIVKIAQEMVMVMVVVMVLVRALSTVVAITLSML